MEGYDISVSDTFFKFQASDGAAADIDQGADEGFFVTVTGASGSGKSTLLAIAGGYLILISVTL